VGHASDARFLVLHGLRLKGFAEPDAVANIVGLDPSEVDTVLKELADGELVLRREGRISGWALTPSGRERHAVLVGPDLEAAGARPVVEDAYRRFLEVNPDLLAVCTAWQLKDAGGQQQVNDHTDAEYDRQVIDRLVAVHDHVRPVTADLREAMDRFARYGTRLREAVEKVVGGDHDWFTKPMIDSYHTVWFELHEDLLVTLGIERSAEEAS
jgi:hypothetical protein